MANGMANSISNTMALSNNSPGIVLENYIERQGNLKMFVCTQNLLDLQ